MFVWSRNVANRTKAFVKGLLAPEMNIEGRSIQLFFFCGSRQTKRHRSDVTFHEVEKEGCGLLREANRGKGEFSVSGKRGGQIRKDRSWKTEVNIGALKR